MFSIFSPLFLFGSAEGKLSKSWLLCNDALEVFENEVVVL
jgi:hypothetical protein